MHTVLTIIVFILIVLSPAIILIPFYFWLINHQTRKVWQHTGILADELGIFLNGRNHIHKQYDLPILNGYYNQRKITLNTQVLGNWERRTRVTNMIIASNYSLPYKFIIRKRNIFTILPSFVKTKQPFKSNYKDFNKKFIVELENVNAIGQLFNTEFCSLLINLPFKNNASLYFNGSAFQYTEHAIITNDKCRNRFFNMINTCHFLLQNIENLKSGT